MFSFTVGNFVSQSVNVLLNSNKLNSTIKIVDKKLVCDGSDLSIIKELLGRKEIKVKNIYPLG